MNKIAAALIREANQADADILAQFAELTFRETFSSENLETNINTHCRKSFSPEIQEEEITNPNTITLLAEIDGSLQGYALFRLNSSIGCVEANRPAELLRLYVSKERHGSGLAHQIIKAVLAAASKAKNDYIWLGVWEHNPRAITFYEKYGFSLVGEHVFHLGEDPQRDLIMMAEVMSE